MRITQLEGLLADLAGPGNVFDVGLAHRVVECDSVDAKIGGRLLDLPALAYESYGACTELGRARAGNAVSLP